MRILQIGLGPLGRKLAADVALRGLGEVVAAVDVAPELRGKRLAELVPESRSRAKVLTDRDAVPQEGIDCAIVATVSELARCAPTFRRLLERGLAVVSTCEELAWPALRHAALAEELDRLAKQHGGRLLGTGVNPGFLMDVFPLVASAVCRDVRSLTVTRIQDAAMRRVQFQQKIGAGLDERAFRAGLAAGRLGHVGLPESLHLLAHGLGLALERWEERIEPVFAERELASALGPIVKGRVCGLRQEARGIAAGGRTLHFVFHATVGEAEPVDRVQIDGDPPVDLIWKGGVPGDEATTAVVLNALRPLRNVPPGLHTMASIRPVGWTFG